MSGQAGRYQRSFPGMVGAMLVLLLVVIAFVVFRDLNRTTPETPVRAVDYAAPADFARDEAEFDLVAPGSLPDGWIATSVRFYPGEPQTWHVGVLTDEQRYVGLEQAARPSGEMVSEHVDEDAEQGADVTVAGETWQTWRDDGDDLALVREVRGVTTLVVGRVSQETLEEFLATLR